MILVKNADGKEEVVVVEDSTPSEDGEFFDAQPSPVAQVSLNALCGGTSSATTFTLKFQFGNNLQLHWLMVAVTSPLSMQSLLSNINSRCHLQTHYKWQQQMARICFLKLLVWHVPT